MDNSEKTPLAGVKLRLIITGIFLLVFLVYYSIMSAMGPTRKVNEIRSSFGMQEDSEDRKDERFYSDSAFISLLKEKAFLQARISMAQTDSVYVTLNMADSIANLEISGVTVHSAKMMDIKTSRILKSGNEYEMFAMLATPMTIVRDFSTIRKEPLLIKMAPKDTSEFKPDVIPDTSDYEPVNYILEMDNGIRIYVYQQTNKIGRDKNRLFFFDLSDRLKNTWNSMKSIALFKVPEYHPFIRIRLPKADAKIFYRAVPRHGQIAVYI